MRHVSTHPRPRIQTPSRTRSATDGCRYGTDEGAHTLQGRQSLRCSSGNALWLKNEAEGKWSRRSRISKAFGAGDESKEKKEKIAKLERMAGQKEVEIALLRNFLGES